jgi:hypothetical protein
MKLNLFLRPFQNSKLLFVKSAKGRILQFRNLSSDSISRQNGLLSGIHDIERAEFYSDNIPIKSSYELLKDPNQIYNICLSNAGGNTTKLNDILKNMRDKAKKFIKSDEVWDRKGLITSIEDIIADDGNFVCILAGKSTGKSLVLRSIEKKFPAKVFRVNLRIHPDMLTGLLWTLRDRQKLDIKDKLKDVTVNVVGVASKIISQYLRVDNIFTDEDFKDSLKIALKEQGPDDLQSLINNLVKNLGGITLVIDEANIALTISDKTEAKIEATKTSFGSIYQFNERGQPGNSAITIMIHSL